MADEFHCRPSDIETERQRTREGLLDDVIEARRFAEIVRLYEADPKAALTTRLGQLLMQVHGELITNG